MKFLKETFGFDSATLLELDRPYHHHDSRQEEKTFCSSIIGDTLRNASALYVDGGNTFYLQYHLHRNHFWQQLRQRFYEKNNILDNNSNTFLYMGCSAGAIVAGKSIKTAYWKGWDSPDIDIEAGGVGNNKDENNIRNSSSSSKRLVQWDEESLQGESLVEKDIFPHYNHALHAALVQEKSATHQYPVQTLSDTEALVIQRVGKNNHLIGGEVMTLL